MITSSTTAFRKVRGIRATAKKRTHLSKWQENTGKKSCKTKKKIKIGLMLGSSVLLESPEGKEGEDL